MKYGSFVVGCLACTGLLLGPASSRAGDAQPVEAGTEAETELAFGESELEAEASAEAAATGARRGEDSSDPARKDVKWGKRWAPENGMTELGVSLGATIYSELHELYEVDPSLTNYGWRPLARAAPTLGLRAGFYPLRHFGMEADVTLDPVGVPDADGGAFGFSARAQIVGQIGLWSVTPFATLGAGTIGVRSPREVLGNNRDGMLSLGGGLKFFLSRYAGMRLEFRNMFASEVGPESTFGTSHQEILLGAMFTLGRDKNEVEIVEAPPTDRDGDGWMDGEDECLLIPGVPEFRGCPPPDTDGDGILDADDKCPRETGVEEYEGCPIPDTDGDCFFDDVDECPDEKGIAPDGCPIRDTDGDGLMDDVDECVEDPETFNEFEDEDGCPDEIPDDLSRFSGKIEGVHFETNKAELKPDSKIVLDEAAEVLDKYDLRVEISGHTDSRGKESWNMKLSQMRADSVRDYLKSRGVDMVQMETIGWGPHKPIDTNDTESGRLNNRRIEFRLLDVDEHAPSLSDRDAEIRRLND